MIKIEYQLIAQRIPQYSVIEQVLSNRGFNILDIEHYLNTTDEDILSPSQILNIEDGVKMLMKHIYNEDNILLIVDSDCDGYTSSAVLINYLYRLFPNYVLNHIHYQLHTGKQHGIILNKIPDNVQLVICADSSSNDYKQHKYLKENNIDVLVIDHHEAERISEYACVINNQLCNYPTKSLSGVGMVYKFCSYIDLLTNKTEADLFLDLVALGEIADVMNLQAFETKRLIEKGIANLRNPYFKHMVAANAFSIGDTLTPTGVAFYVAPYVNATIRVGTQEEKLMLFESMLDFKAYDLIPSTKRGCKGQVESRVEQACRSCKNIKNRQTKNRDASLAIAEHLIEEYELLQNKILAIRIPVDFSVDKNLTGLIANVLMDKYKRPVLLLNQTEKNGEIWWEGSARGYDKSKLSDFRAFASAFPDFEECGAYAQGHANAYGFGMPDNIFPQFIQWSNIELSDFDFSPCYKVDFIFGMRDCSPNDILSIANFNYLWGQGVEEPRIAFENISISNNNITLLSPDKNPTLKITLPSGITCIKFKSSEEEYESLVNSSGCTIINVVGRCEKNEWGGNVTPQILIEDYEIVKTQKYYF